MSKTTAPNRRLAVLVKGWPRLSETFIAQELVALEGRGLDFDLWSLRFPTDKKTHPLHDQLGASVHYLPEYLHQEPLRVGRGLVHSLFRRTFPRTFFAFLRDLRRDWTRNRVRRFGQACVLTCELPADTGALYAHFLHTPSSVARYTGMLRGLPWAFSAHAKDIWTSPEWDLREKLAARSGGARFGVTCTEYGAAHLRQLATDTPVHLVYHGLQLNRFPPPPDRLPRRQGAPLHLLSVGRLVEKKGFDRLIDAFALLDGDLDWHWTHVGGGPLAERLRRQAEAAGVAERITWRGACDQPEVIEAMRASDLFILPSRIATDGDRDGLPNVLMEAASQRLAILATPVSAIPEFITDGVHGLLRPDDPSELATAIATVAAHPEAAAERADAALNRLKQDFAMEPGIARLETDLRQMLGNT